MNINKAFIAGRICNDLHMKVTTSGLSTLELRVAVNSKRKNKTTGEVVEDVQFHTCILFGKVAEIANQYMMKGQVVFVTGRIVNRSWEYNGQKYYKTEILCDEMQMGERPRGSSAPNSSTGEDSPPLDTKDEAEEDVAKDVPF